MGVELILLFRKPLGALAEQFGGFAFVQLEAARVSGVEVLELKALAVGDPERVNVLWDLVEDFFFQHSTTFFSSDAHSGAAAKTRAGKRPLTQQAAEFPGERTPPNIPS